MDDIIAKQLRAARLQMTIRTLPNGIRLRVAADEEIHQRLSDSITVKGPHENGAAMWMHAYRGGLAMADYISTHAGDFAGKTVLDIGTGSGIVALTAAKAGARVIAVDSNPLALQMANYNAALNKLSIDWIEGDFMQEGRAMTRAYDSVDIVTAADVTYPQYSAQVGDPAVYDAKRVFHESMATMFARAERLQAFVKDGKQVLFSSHNLHLGFALPERDFEVEDLNPDFSRYQGVNMGLATGLKSGPPVK